MKRRILKVEPLWYDYERHDAPHSRIRLKGRWLIEAGFLPSDHVVVMIGKGWLYIRKQFKNEKKGGETNGQRESSEEQRGQGSV